MSGYHREPALSRDHVAFVTEDALWLGPAGGGKAWRLTAGMERICTPCFSPDGRAIAFSSNLEGSLQVYRVPVEGGVPERLTFETHPCFAVGFRPAGSLVVRSLREAPLRSLPSLYEIPPAGGDLVRLPVGSALHISFGEDDDRVALGRNSLECAYWKRYRGGMTGEVWVGSLRDRSFRRLGMLEGNPVRPTIVRGRVYFVTDSDGVGNIWSCLPTGEDLRQHTHHRDYYVRALGAHGAVLVYQQGARIWRFDVDDGEPEPIEFATRPGGTQLARKFVKTPEHLQEVDLSPDGKQLVCAVRGKAFAMGAFSGPVRRIGAPSGVRYRGPVWLRGNEQVAVVSDEGGEEAIEVWDAEGGERLRRFTPEGLRRIDRLHPSPAGPVLAVSDVSGNVLRVDLANGKEGQRLVGQSSRGAIREIAWSPDGRYIAWTTKLNWLLRGGILHIHDFDTSRTETLSTEELPVHTPTFDPDGRLLFVLSERDFNPVLDTVQFGASCPRATRVYAYVLSNEGLSPADARWMDIIEEEDEKKQKEEALKREEKRRERAEKKKAGQKAEEEEEEEPPAPVRIDLDGLAERLVEIGGIPTGSYSDLQAASGVLLFLSRPMQGLLDQKWWEKGKEELPELLAFDLRKGVQTRIMKGVADFRVRGEKTLIETRHRLRILPTGEEPPSDSKGKPRNAGWVDLGRIRVEIVPGDEWRQMFVEAWRLQREHFWTETMAGVDWKGMRDLYLPLLERVSTRAELSDLIWELQGELGTSHAYEFGGDYPETRSYDVGFLGADLAWDGTGYVVQRVLAGDSWSLDDASPLAAPGVNVKAGDRIVKVGGTSLDERTPPSPLLVHRARQHVEIEVQPAGGGETKRVVVRPIDNEMPLRYRDWANRNREHVRARTEGRAGYLHLPDMSGAGLSEFFRAFRSQSKKPGLIVDVRSNGGGFVSSFIIEALRRKVLGFDRPRYGRFETYPLDGVRGPIVCIADQFAGSDGDMFCQAFKSHAIGPVIGRRTWGGVIGIDLNEYLVDGTIVTQPEYAFCFLGEGWNIENRGVEPDIEVVADPASMAEGKDVQLERAINVIRDLLEENPVEEPTWPEVPERRVARGG